MIRTPSIRTPLKMVGLCRYRANILRENRNHGVLLRFWTSQTKRVQGNYSGAQSLCAKLLSHSRYALMPYGPTLLYAKFGGSLQGDVSLAVRSASEIHFTFDLHFCWFFVEWICDWTIVANCEKTRNHILKKFGYFATFAPCKIY